MLDLKEIALILCLSVCAALIWGSCRIAYDLGTLAAVVEAQQEIIEDLQTTHNTQSASH